jgi:FkbM family methyltransferase
VPLGEEGDKLALSLPGDGTIRIRGEEMTHADINGLIKMASFLIIPPPFYEKCRRILIYGAGNIGKDMFRVMNARGIKVDGFLDRKAVPGEAWNGIPIYPPAWDGLSAGPKRETGIIIGIHNPDAEIPPIIEYLKKQRYGTIITPVEFYDYFSEDMGDYYWLTSRSSYKEWEKDILDGYAVWDDEPSRQLYLGLLNCRLFGNYSAQPPPESDRTHFPEFITWRAPLRFVDGGAYDGDTLRSVLDSRYDVDVVAAFEPDPENFKKLSNYVSSNWSRPVYLWPCGIYSTTGQLTFSSGGGVSSSLSLSGNMMVQVVALDDVIPLFKPNLIKFDIEGAEFEGLMGAKRIIQENRPGLAICVYHKPAHLWQIPLLVKSWDLGYKLYLRMYKNNGFDAVMYASSD